MPEHDQWETFFQPGRIVETLGCADRPGDVAEFGCGYGTFTLPVASRLDGTVYCFDIESSMVFAVQEEASTRCLGNICATCRDFMDQGSGLPSGSMVHAMAYNILHIENPMLLLHEAYRVLADCGVLSIIHWRTDIETPRGPSAVIRPSPEQCREWATAAGFMTVQFARLGEAAPWHYALLCSKK